MTSLIASILLGLIVAASSPAPGSAPGPAPSRVAGTLMGDTGAPIATSHAHLGRSYETPVVSVAADRDGRFTLTTTERGLVVLKLTGVGHEPVELPLWLAGGESIELRATLGGYRVSDKPGPVKVTGDFNQFSRKSGKSMTKQPDGTYAVAIEAAAPFRYQILGALASGQAYEGQSTDGFEWGGVMGPTGYYQDGYRAVATPRQGKVRIVFDPARLPVPKSTGRAMLTDPSSLSAAVGEFEQQLRARVKAYRAAASAHYRAGKPYETFTYDWSPAIAALKPALERETRAPLREALSIELWTLCQAPPRTACDARTTTELLEQVPADSTIWGWIYTRQYQALDMLALRAAEDPQVKAYMTRLIDARTSPRMNARLLFEALTLADRQGSTAGIAEYHARLTGEYPKTDEARRAVAYGPERTIRPGQPLPAFSVASLKSPAVDITSADVAGKTLLIDVWATWCPGCRIGNPTLHKLYEKYRGAGLEILSVSADDSVDEVAEYRAGADNPMPWLHGYIGPVRGGPFMKLLEVSGYPTYILVDRSGKILLKTHGHEEVERALARTLGGASSSGTGSSSPH